MLTTQSLKKLKQILNKEFREFVNTSTKSFVLKKDNSPVTKLDISISNKLKDFFKKHKQFKDFHFYSEEDHTRLVFPNLITVDPVDGTKGLLNGTWESSLSLSILTSPSLNSENFSWIYNPCTGLEINSNTHFIKSTFENKTNNPLVGLISKSEFNNGLFKIKEAINLKTCGSIALKLAKLCLGDASYVISKREKSIWDIAAGTVLCHERGISLYEKGNRKVTRLNKKNYSPPLIWCRPKDLESILKTHKVKQC
jgi:myo-inositol-1(or 4)-monophosphatase